MKHEDLDVYKRTYKLALEIHEVSFTLATHLQRDLGDQMRRASRSIPSNIAEGCGRAKSGKDTINFLRTALGSNDEMIFNLKFCRDVNLIDVERVNKFLAAYEITGKQLNKLIQSISSN